MTSVPDRSSSPLRSTAAQPLSLALIVVAVGVVVAVRGKSDGPTTDAAPASAEVSSCAADDATCPRPEPPAEASFPTVSAGDVCRNVGYLCAELEATGAQRIFRWPSDTERITVRVPLPEHEPPIRARRLQRAAVRGLSAWQGHPFTLRFLDRLEEGSADIQVRWAAQMGGSGLGSTRTRWTLEGDRRSFVVVDFALATRSPYDGRVELDPSQVELTAAHEMGHALGLPHSDDPRDVMYPKNTALTLTARDYLTLESLYELPNGAEIQP